MHTLLKKFLGIASALAVGAILYIQALPLTLQTGWAITAKLDARAELCPWAKTVRFLPDMDAFEAAYAETSAAAVIWQTDEAAGLVQVEHPNWVPLWVPTPKADFPLLSYLVAEHDWMEAEMDEFRIRPGDVVVDVGAHVGTFVAKALSRGASKVIAIEPHPTNQECLRRNFAAEIEQGKVILVQEAAWNEESTLELHVGWEYNSGAHSISHDRGAGTITVRSRPIDEMLNELGIERVDLIKMDIEGAERQALLGSLDTLRDYRPRLLLETNHEVDDAEVLPEIARRAHPDYAIACGPCRLFQPEPNKLIPHMVVVY